MVLFYDWNTGEGATFRAVNFVQGDSDHVE